MAGNPIMSSAEVPSDIAGDPTLHTCDVVTVGVAELDRYGSVLGSEDK